jgi:hypothetical protein
MVLRDASEELVARSGDLDLRAQTAVSSARMSDTPK